MTTSFLSMASAGDSEGMSLAGSWGRDPKQRVLGVSDIWGTLFAWSPDFGDPTIAGSILSSFS